jgi:DNA-binding response OmpR family regulator
MSNFDSPSSAAWRAVLGVPPVHIPARILVAEDDSDTRCLVVEALCKDGYEVLEAKDGGRLLVMVAQCIAKPVPDLVDLLVSDVRMPTCTGLQILEQLRRAHSPIPVILMTAFGDAATREHATMLCAVLFDKPFDVDELRAAVAWLLRPQPMPGNT